MSNESKEEMREVLAELLPEILHATLASRPHSCTHKCVFSPEEQVSVKTTFATSRTVRLAIITAVTLGALGFVGTMLVIGIKLAIVTVSKQSPAQIGEGSHK